MADLTIDSFNEAARFQKVLFQRAKVIRESEVNELQDILRVANSRLAFAIGGDGSPNDGLKCLPNGGSNSVTLAAGDFLIQGRPLNFSAAQTFSGLTTNPGPAIRTDTLYLAVSETEVGDPSAVPELGETTRRRQLTVTLAVAEGVAIPTASLLPIHQGGTAYAPLAALTRPANQDTVAASQIKDLRPNLPANALGGLIQRNTASGASKLVVQAKSSEGVSDLQLGVLSENNENVFAVDKKGNVSTLGTLNPNRVKSLIPEATDTYDLGTPQLNFRNAYISGNLFLGNSQFDVSTIQGDVTWTNPSGTSMDLDGSTGHVGFGGAFDPNRQVHIYQTATIDGALTVGKFDSNILPDGDNTRTIGNATTRWASVYAAKAFVNAAQIDTLTGLAGGGVNTSLTLDSSVLPKTGSQYTLGSLQKTFSSMYMDTLYTKSIGSSVANGGNLVINSGVNVLPTDDNAQDFGSAAKRFANLYAANLAISTLTIDNLKSSGPITNLFMSLVPNQGSSYDLGSSAKTLRTMYVDTIVAGGAINRSGNWTVNDTLTVAYLAPYYTTGPLANYVVSTTHFIPQNSKVQSLGIPNNYWKEVYAANAGFDGAGITTLVVGTLTCNGSMGTNASPLPYSYQLGMQLRGNIDPYLNYNYNLGSPSGAFSNVYSRFLVALEGLYVPISTADNGNTIASTPKSGSISQCFGMYYNHATNQLRVYNTGAARWYSVNFTLAAGV